MSVELPRISIVTPSYNQGPFIELTIQSILSQDYPDVEYLVMDGGSTDETLEILRKYDGKLTWVSEADGGQSDAINKGLRRATGEVVAFLNSDDLYEPGALLAVGEFFANHRDAAWVTGNCRIIDHVGREIRNAITLYKRFWLGIGSLRALLVLNYISQPATFWRRAAMDEIGYFDENLYYTMDYDYWLRLWQRSPLSFIDRYLASFRIHPGSKGGMSIERYFQEGRETARRYTGSRLLLGLYRTHAALTVASYKRLAER